MESHLRLIYPPYLLELENGDRTCVLGTSDPHGDHSLLNVSPENFTTNVRKSICFNVILGKSGGGCSLPGSAVPEIRFALALGLGIELGLVQVLVMDLVIYPCASHSPLLGMSFTITDPWGSFIVRHP